MMAREIERGVNLLYELRNCANVDELREEREEQIPYLELPPAEKSLEQEINALKQQLVEMKEMLESIRGSQTQLYLMLNAALLRRVV